MGERSYREAVVRLREVYDLLGPYRGPCGICGACWDARHRQADAITGAVIAGDHPYDVAVEYGLVTAGEGQDREPDIEVLTVTVAVLAADPRRHGLTRGRAAGVEREVWQGLTETGESN